MRSTPRISRHLRQGAHVWLLLVTLSLGACRTAFVPPAAEIPLFGGRGDLQLSAVVGSAAPQLGLAYSPADHVGLVLTGGSSLRNNDGAKPNYIRFVDLMAGYYLRPESNYRFELFAGIERGWTGEQWLYSGSNGPLYAIQDSADSVWRTITGTYTRTMLQLNVGAVPLTRPRSSQSLEIGISLNLSYLQYQRLTQADSVDENRPQGRVQRELARNGALFFDPSLMLRAGDATGRFEVEVGTAHTARAVDFNWGAFHVSAGFRFFFDVGGGL